ncbi:MAG TPA: ATP-binding protein [Methylomirabilota bacterium]|nr:ATP-binding protein [Methylomirabilota bacterium]
MDCSGEVMPAPRPRAAERWVRRRALGWTDPLSPDEGLGMRLSSKIFLASALVIVVLAGVSALSLSAVGRLVSANREIATRAIPALSITASALEAIPPLLGLEARAVVLGDPRYATAWTKLAAQMAEDLERLATYTLSEREARHLREASAAFEEYRRIVAQEHALLRRGHRARALRLTDAAAPVLAERVRASLDGLMAATRARVLAAQDDADRLEARTWTAVLFALGVAVALALVGTAIIARRMTRSLALLSSATAAVAASAFREPIAVESRDEIGALARSFNSMASQLHQMEETKREFFATVSHELRSPLTSIRGAVDLLHNGAPGPLTESQKRLANIIGQSSARLLGLTNQILEMSRLRAGLVELDRKPLDLAGLVDRVVEELHPQAEEAGVALDRERYGSHFVYLGDEERLYQLVVNLGANAIRFTPRGGRVIVRIIDASPEFELQVEDTGMGIPADALPSIFDPYRQAHQDRGGTGLGLAIVQGVANAHGGRVTAESREGEGSRFTVLLPRS